jgi:uncharacterized protein (TIGR03118 family)
MTRSIMIVLRLVAVLSVALLSPTGIARADNFYLQTNLVSDLPGVAVTQDANLVNPWGISFSSGSPFWIADNGSGLSTLYNGAGGKLGLVVTIPGPGGSGPSAPTGTIFNPINGNATNNFNKDLFLFATEDGTIDGWRGSLGTTAEQPVDNSPSGAVYKGLALANNGTHTLLYATNFNAGTVDIFDENFAPTTVPGGFQDSTIPAGFAPFDIENIGGDLYVTYAMQDGAKHDDVAGPGNGFVDVFDPNGNLLQRLISNGPLNSPWGLALAPANFGAFSSDLLVGNFGDGTINAFNPLNGDFLGTLQDGMGNPIVIQGLWGLAFGNGVQQFDPNILYFTAGIPGPDQVEDHGLFGGLRAVPEPSSMLLFGTAFLAIAVLTRRRAVGSARL